MTATTSTPRTEIAMTTYVLLRIDDDTEAARLVEDMTEYPDNPILTPSQENTVYATVVHVLKVDSAPTARTEMSVAATPSGDDATTVLYQATAEAIAEKNAEIAELREDLDIVREQRDLARDAIEQWRATYGENVLKARQPLPLRTWRFTIRSATDPRVITVQAVDLDDACREARKQMCRGDTGHSVPVLVR